MFCRNLLHSIVMEVSAINEDSVDGLRVEQPRIESSRARRSQPARVRLLPTPVTRTGLPQAQTLCCPDPSPLSLLNYVRLGWLGNLRTRSPQPKTSSPRPRPLAWATCFRPTECRVDHDPTLLSSRSQINRLGEVIMPSCQPTARSVDGAAEASSVDRRASDMAQTVDRVSQL